MEKSQKNVLPFPKPPEEPATIVVQIGSDRFAIHWEIEELPPAVPVVSWQLASRGHRRRSERCLRRVTSSRSRRSDLPS